jgi:hypothetical protein
MVKLGFGGRGETGDKHLEGVLGGKAL